MVKYEVEIRGMEQQQRKFKQYEQISNRRLARAMSDSVKTVARVTQSTAPRVSGDLAAGVDHEVLIQGAEGVVGRVLNRDFKGLWVEFGTRAHGVSSDVFVQAYGTDPGTAFLLARRIRARGARGKKFMYRAFKASERAINVFFERALKLITEDLAV